MPSTMLIGQLALEHGLITPEHLRAALEVQARRPGAPLGSLLVEAGCLDQAALRMLLGVQLRRTAEAMAFRSLHRRVRERASGAPAAGERASAGAGRVRLPEEQAVCAAAPVAELLPGEGVADLPCAVAPGSADDALAVWGLRVRALGVTVLTILFVALAICAHEGKGAAGGNGRAAAVPVPAVAHGAWFKSR